MENYLDSKKFKGTILAKKNDEIVFARATGFANLSFHVPNNMETIYGIASIGKLLTAIGILFLLKEKNMRTTDAIYPYLEMLDADIPKPLTFHHLLTHTSGVERYYTIDPYFHDQTSGNQDQWKTFWKKHPNFLLQTPIDYLPYLNDVDFFYPIGETFYYTNTSYILLGILIQVLSGQTYSEYVTHRVIKRLKLERTLFLAFDEVYENVAEGYTPFYHQGIIKGWKKNIYRLPIVGSADGGIFSNVYDLDKLISELRNKNGILSDITYDILHPHVLMKNEESWKSFYGYGITMMYHEGELFRYGLAGGDFGVAAGAYYYPKEQLSIIILSNYNTSDDNWMFNKEFHMQFLDL